ncbi:MAG: hypothetical protein ACLPKT_08645 [Methylocella sp.]
MDYSKEGFDKIHKQADALSALEEARRWGFETLKIEERIRANNPGLRDFQLELAYDALVSAHAAVKASRAALCKLMEP